MQLQEAKIQFELKTIRATKAAETTIPLGWEESQPPTPSASLSASTVSWNWSHILWKIERILVKNTN